MVLILHKSCLWCLWQISSLTRLLRQPKLCEFLLFSEVTSHITIYLRSEIQMYCTMQIAPCSSTSSGNPEKKQWEGGGIVEEVVTAPCNGCRPGVDCLESVQHVQYFVPDRLTGNYFQKQMTGRSRSRQINRDMKMILCQAKRVTCVFWLVCVFPTAALTISISILCLRHLISYSSSRLTSATDSTFDTWDSTSGSTTDTMSGPFHSEMEAPGGRTVGNMALMPLR